jgi:outer membrane protein assembly factor BamB
MKRLLTLCALIVFAALCSGADWRQFRGPGGNAVGEEKGLPVKWSETQNVLWKTRLPGLGTSSPITVGEHIFLTCYSGYAESVEKPGDMNKLMRHVVCLKRQSGEIEWTKDVEPKLPESAYRAGNDSWHGYSSSTPASDGERLYVFFGKSGVFCFDLKGKQLWKADVGIQSRGWGSGSSVVLYKDLVIVNASVESGSLVALNKMTGKPAWKTSGVGGAWNTPLLVDLPGGKAELVLSLPGRAGGKIVGYDPQSGKELWRCDGIPDGGYVCPSVVAHGGIVYAIGGRKNTAVAVRAGERGDVKPLWTTGRGSNVASPVYHDGHLYWMHERNGIAYCLNASTGETVYEERIQPRPGVVYSSGVVADGKIYYVSQHSGTFVMAAKPKFELLARNTFAENDRTNASPVPDNGRLLIRSDRYLYCVGNK